MVERIVCRLAQANQNLTGMFLKQFWNKQGQRTNVYENTSEVL